MLGRRYIVEKDRAVLRAQKAYAVLHSHCMGDGRSVHTHAFTSLAIFPFSCSLYTQAGFVHAPRAWCLSFLARSSCMLMR